MTRYCCFIRIEYTGIIYQRRNFGYIKVFFFSQKKERKLVNKSVPWNSFFFLFLVIQISLILTYLTRFNSGYSILRLLKITFSTASNISISVLSLSHLNVNWNLPSLGASDSLNLLANFLCCFTMLLQHITLRRSATCIPNTLQQVMTEIVEEELENYSRKKRNVVLAPKIMLHICYRMQTSIFIYSTALHVVVYDV